MDYLIKDTITYRGKRRFPDEVIDISESALVEELLAAGLIASPSVPEGAGSETNTTTTKTGGDGSTGTGDEKPNPDSKSTNADQSKGSDAGAGNSAGAGNDVPKLSLDDAIVQLVSENDEAKLMAGGKPKVEALAALTDDEVNGAIRDAAFEKLKQDGRLG